MKEYLGEIVITVVAILGNIVTFYTTKRIEQKKATKEVESMRLSNDREDEKYKGDMLSSQQRMFTTIQELQASQIEFGNRQIELESRLAKLKAEEVLLKSRLEKLAIENKQLTDKLEELMIDYEKVVTKYKKVYEENQQLKLKLK